jgi:PAS domain S-box-containing protein
MKTSSQPKATPHKNPRRRSTDAPEGAACPVPYRPDYKDLVESAAQGILIHRNFRPLYANKSMALLFGFDSVKEVLSLPLIRDLIPADSWQQTEEAYDTLVHGKREPQTSWIRAVRADGSELWLSLTERVVKWDGKTAVQWNLFDISQRVAMEQSLLESEQRLRAMLEILPTPCPPPSISNGASTASCCSSIARPASCCNKARGRF